MKLNRIIIAGLCLASMASCQKENDLNPGKQYTITVGAEDTKVAIDGLNVVFNAGDEIVVHDRTTPKHNKFTTTQGGANASFTGTLVAEIDYYTVAYPYGIDGTDYTFGGSSFIYNIPEVQVATPNSVDPKAHFLVANNVTDLSQPITLKNLVSLMKVEVPAGLKVREIQVGGAKACNTAICGKTQYFYNGNFSIPEADKTSSVITVVPQSGKEFIEEGTYYVAVMPRQVTGITIAYVNENYQLCKRQSANAVTFTAGHVKSFGTLGAGYTAVTGNTVLRTGGDEVQFTGRLKKIAGGAGTATTDDNVIEKIVFKAHSLYSLGIASGNTQVSAGVSAVPAYAVLKGTTMYVYTEAPCFTINANSANLFRNFAALKEVTFNNVDTQANTSFEWMFRNDVALETVDFGICDLSKVINMSNMFPNLTSLKTVRFGKTATTGCTNFKGMLSGCTNVAELNLGPNFTVSHLSDKSMCNNAFYNTAQAFGPTPQKCKLYMSQSEYDECTTGSCSNSALNKARFAFTPVTE